MSAPSVSYSDLRDRKAFVTGGATGIGLAIASALVEQGASVAIGDLDEAAAEKAAKSLGGRATALEVDVRKRASVEAAFSEVLHRLGDCDILIANAGVSTMRQALDLTDEEWDLNFDVNIRGVFLANQIAARHFVETGTGCIINTASLAAKVGAGLLAHYSASKFAVLGWTQALARELAPRNIRVNAVCPGFVKTGMQGRETAWEAELRGITREEVLRGYVEQTPLGRLETPEDVASVAVFLCTHQARFMTGQGINVTGGVYMA